MLTPTILATLIATQVQGPLPQTAALVYSGIPGIVRKIEFGWGSRPPSDSAAPKLPVRMTSHSVVFELTKGAATVSSVSLFHNDGPNPVSLVLKLPVDAQNPVLGRGWDIDFTATLDSAPLKIGPWKEEMTLTEIAGAPTTRMLRYKSAAVTFKVKGTHVLRISYQVPMGKAGLDGMNRLIAYETNGASAWSGSMDRLNFTVHYGPGVVFHVIEAEPNWGWQIGDKGAFFKQDSFHPEGDTLARFIFYPGGYDKIGTIGH